MGTLGKTGLFRVAVDKSVEKDPRQIYFHDIPFIIDQYGLVCFKFEDLEDAMSVDGYIKTDAGSLGSLANRVDRIHEWKPTPVEKKW